MPPRRKVPFSNKQKKEQLKAKRERKQRAQRVDGNGCLNSNARNTTNQCALYTSGGLAYIQTRA